MVKHRYTLELFTDDLTPVERFGFDAVVADAIKAAVRALRVEEDFSGGSHVKTEHLLED